MPRLTPFAGLFKSFLAAPTALRVTATARTSATRLTSLLTPVRPAITSPPTGLIPSLRSGSPILSQLRFGSYGAEYQPSQRKRKRKHGFLSRQRGGKDGLATLRRRRKHGRRFLSH